MEHGREIPLPGRALPPPLTPRVLEGETLRLVPLRREHLDALCGIGLDPRLWEEMTIRVHSRREMLAYIDNALADEAAGTALPFTVTIRDTEQVAGTTRLHSYCSRDRRIEIGFTWLAAHWQGTLVNREAKHLLLSHAFDTLHCLRVGFKTDVSNARSRRALSAIGAVEEGVLRHYLYSPHRGPRDVAVYSILEHEWRLRHGRTAPSAVTARRYS